MSITSCNRKGGGPFGGLCSYFTDGQPITDELQCASCRAPTFGEDESKEAISARNSQYLVSPLIQGKAKLLLCHNYEST